jgi:hypothetical protein
MRMRIKGVKVSVSLLLLLCCQLVCLLEDITGVKVCKAECCSCVHHVFVLPFCCSLCTFLLSSALLSVLLLYSPLLCSLCSDTLLLFFSAFCSSDSLLFVPTILKFFFGKRTNGNFFLGERYIA